LLLPVLNGSVAEKRVKKQLVVLKEALIPLLTGSRRSMSKRRRRRVSEVVSSTALISLMGSVEWLSSKDLNTLGNNCASVNAVRGQEEKVEEPLVDATERLIQRVKQTREATLAECTRVTEAVTFSLSEKWEGSDPQRWDRGECSGLALTR